MNTTRPGSASTGSRSASASPAPSMPLPIAWTVRFRRREPKLVRDLRRDGDQVPGGRGCPALDRSQHGRRHVVLRGLLAGEIALNGADGRDLGPVADAHARPRRGELLDDEVRPQRANRPAREERQQRLIAEQARGVAARDAKLACRRRRPRGGTRSGCAAVTTCTSCRWAASRELISRSRIEPPPLPGRRWSSSARWRIFMRTSAGAAAARSRRPRRRPRPPATAPSARAWRRAAPAPPATARPCAATTSPRPASGGRGTGEQDDQRDRPRDRADGQPGDVADQRAQRDEGDRDQRAGAQQAQARRERADGLEPADQQRGHGERGAAADGVGQVARGLGEVRRQHRVQDRGGRGCPDDEYRETHPSSVRRRPAASGRRRVTAEGREDGDREREAEEERRTAERRGKRVARDVRVAGEQHDGQHEVDDGHAGDERLDRPCPRAAEQPAERRRTGVATRSGRIAASAASRDHPGAGEAPKIARPGRRRARRGGRRARP